MSFSKHHRPYTLNGILFVALFALSSLYIAEIPWLVKAGISPLVIAIVLGIIYGNTLRHRFPQEWVPGIQFSAKKLLRVAIVLYGFRITFQEIVSIGMAGLLIDIFMVCSTLFVGYWIGIKVFKLDRHLALLISAGAAICGAAAVLATEDVLKSEAYKTSIAVGTVVLFGTLAMFLYPELQHLGMFTLTNPQFGTFAGASVHEVAQALVAGSSISPEAGNIAVIVKMTRVLLLIPVLVFLSVNESRFKKDTTETKTKLKLPWFAIGFGVVIAFNSLKLLPESLISMINHLDIFLLTMAMGAIGIETHFSQLKKVGIKPFYLSIMLFIWLTGVGYGLVKWFV